MANAIKLKVTRAMTKRKENAIPMRTMVGYIIRETEKAMFVKLHGQPEPTSECLHCGITLRNPVSLLYGIGPVCGKHMYLNPLGSKEDLDAYIDVLREQLKKVKWEGWIPKSQVVQLTNIPEYTVVFKHEGKEYSTQTLDKGKVEYIQKNAEEVVSLEEAI